MPDKFTISCEGDQRTLIIERFRKKSYLLKVYSGDHLDLFRRMNKDELMLMAKQGFFERARQSFMEWLDGGINNA